MPMKWLVTAILARLSYEDLVWIHFSNDPRARRLAQILRDLGWDCGCR
jgi:hypothetical protein